MAIYDHQPGFTIDDAAAYRADLATVFDRLPTAARTLELGCGSGVFTQFLHAVGLDVLGVDNNEAQLAEARARVPDVVFSQYDVEASASIDALVTAHGRFALLISRYVIHELADPIETFTLWKKLLQPGGSVVLIENCWMRSDWGWSDWGKRTDYLPLATTQTWATAAYCLQKAGFNSVACDWLYAVNALENMRVVSGFRLYRIAASPSD